MRWLEWLAKRNDTPTGDDIDVSAEVTAAKIKAAEVRRARIAANEKTAEYMQDVKKLVAAGTSNHFGESITLGMERRRHGD